MKQSSVNMVPSKVEITLRKADSVAWGKLEDPNFKPEPEPADNTVGSGENEAHRPNWDIDDDDISDSDDDWAYDTPENRKQTEKKEKREVTLEEQRKKIEAEMRKAEEDRRKAEEQRREEEEEGFEDMPELDS